MALMTAAQLIAKAKEVQKSLTVYMWGTYGQVLTDKLITDKANQYKTKNTAPRVARHRKLVGQGYSAWDCVGLIKGLLWGWTPGKNPPYGANGVPDTGSDGMYKNYTTHQSTDFSTILPGEAVWIPGHIGIYIGGGLVIEATSKWDDKVMITALGNIGSVKGYQKRSWTHHGRLRWIDYADQPEPAPTPKPDPSGEITHTVKRGDTLWGLATKYLGAGSKYTQIKAWNGLTSDVILVGQKLVIYPSGKPDPAPDYIIHTVKKGDTPWGLAVKYLGSGSRYTEIMDLSGLKRDATIYVGDKLKIPTRSALTPPKEYKVRVNTKNGLNVRASATTSSKVLRTLGNGTIVTISKEQKQGTRVWGYSATYKGWIALDFTVKA